MTAFKNAEFNFYLSCDKEGNAETQPHNKGWEKWSIVQAGGGKVNIKNNEFGRYLSIWKDGDAKEVRTMDHNKGYEEFTIEDVAGGKIAIKSTHGTYLSCNASGQLSAAPHLKGWEHWVKEGGDAAGGAAAGMFAAAAGSGQDYQANLWGCLDDKMICLDAMCCTCCQIGRQCHVVDTNTTGMNFICCLAAYCGAVELQICCLRKKVEEKFGLSGPQSGCCKQCCFAIYCPCCSLIQTGRELKIRAADPGSFCGAAAAAGSAAGAAAGGAVAGGAAAGGGGAAAAPTCAKDIIGKQCRFKAHTGGYLTVAGDDVKITPMGTAFQVGGEDGKIFLQAGSQWLSVDNDAPFIRMRPHNKGWEKLDDEWVSGKIAFKSAHGNYISVEKDGDLKVMPHNKGWEQFVVEFA